MNGPNEPATQQATEISDEQRDQWADEFIEMETSFTIYQLTLLLKIKAGLEPMGIYEPVWNYCTGEKAETPPLYQAPLLGEHVLFQCAQAAALERLGYVILENDEQEGPRWKLTTKGVEAAAWWSETLRESLPIPEESAT